MRKTAKKLIHETVGGEPYEYYPVGCRIVVAPGVCGGRPAFKYTRIDVRYTLGLLTTGRTVKRVAQGYDLLVAAVREAVALAANVRMDKAALVNSRNIQYYSVGDRLIHLRGWSAPRHS